MSFAIHRHAADDLSEIRKVAPEALPRIARLLQQIRSDPDLLDRLTQHRFGERGLDDFQVSQWVQQQQQGNNLWRLKVWDLEDAGLRYRIVYAFDHKRHTHYVLAIAPRDFDYAPDHPITRRILADYDALQ